jgi:biopolymer transport protein ExbB
MFVLLALSLVALTLVLERLIFFFRIRRDDAFLVRQVERELRQAGPGSARELLAEAGGPVRDVLRACLEVWELGPEPMEEAVRFEGHRAVERLESHLKGLSVVSQCSPLLGLLGTVLGMIEAFMRIEEQGNEIQVSALAGGIWEALLTTAFGLIVAIPALFAYQYFDGKVNRYVTRMEAAGERLVSLRRQGEGPT